MPMVEFYLVPVAVVGWLARSLWYGFAVAVAAACGIAVSLSVSGHPTTSLIVAAGEHITCSIGLISLHEAPECVSDLLHAGDRVM